MDDRWEPEITEYGAINITGFRIVDTERRYVREFLDGWKRLDPTTSIGAGKESITVRTFSLRYSTLPSIDIMLVLRFSRRSRRRRTSCCCC